MNKQNLQVSGSVSRIDALDVARGIALLAMATYHFSWDLELFGYLEPGTASSGFLKFYARAIATSFLFIVGFSLVLATINGVRWRSFFGRLAQVGGAAIAISVITFYAMPSGWIFFGILHHIVFASLIGLIFLRLHWIFVLLTAVFCLALPFTGLIETSAIWLSFIGLYSVSPNSNDFVPLFPWLSASLAGVAFAKWGLEQSWLTDVAKLKARNFPGRQLKFLGQHSLAFYLIHQPLLIALVWLASQFIPPDIQPSSAMFQNECQAVCRPQFAISECKVYCNCFETELNKIAAQSAQLSAQDPSKDQSTAISALCSKLMQEIPKQ